MFSNDNIHVYCHIIYNIIMFFIFFFFSVVQELLLSGVPEIDLLDWQANTAYVDCDEESQAVKVGAPV